MEIDCRSEEGITIGLVDAIIAISRILAPRLTQLVSTQAIEEALKDMAQDEDFRTVSAQYKWL